MIRTTRRPTPPSRGSRNGSFPSLRDGITLWLAWRVVTRLVLGGLMVLGLVALFLLL